MLFGSRRGAGDCVIVGLGNPGPKYACTRHNAGVRALTALAERLGVTLTRARFHALTAEAELGGRHCLLLFPQTYMNESGVAVAEALRFYKLKPSQLLVLSDDISLPVGTVRVRRKGSDGGQKGLRSIIGHVDSEEFARVKIGVGQKPHPEMDLADWVLSRFTAAEEQALAPALEAAAGAAELIAAGEIDQAMNRYSR